MPYVHAANRALLYEQPLLFPATLLGLQLWLKADTLQLSDGDSVTTWSDSSGNVDSGGNVRDAAQITMPSVSPPVYKTGQSVNGGPMVLFDPTSPGGTKELHGRLPATGISSTDGATFYFYINELDTTNRQALWQDDGGGAPQLMPGCWVTAAPALVGWRGANGIHALATPTSGIQVLTYVFDALSGVCTIYRNGIAVGADTWSYVKTDTGYYLGANQVQNIPFHGYLAEMLWYSYAHSTSTRSKVEQYLRRKWG